MTGVLFNGRLGNQLFQFAFLLYLKSRNKGKIVFFVNPHHAYLTRYFDLGSYNWYFGTKWYSVITRLAGKFLPFKTVYVHNFFDPKPRDPDDGVIYHGYFQTDWYIKHTPEPEAFPIKQKYRDQFNEKFGELFKNNKTLVVHIRRTDYLTYGKRDISLPIDYFKKRIAEIEDIDSYKVIFLSDDMDYVQDQIPARDNFIFSHNSEILDFQIIQNADAKIISNSSFSWWASYLGKPGSLVFAPKNWLGFRIGREHPKGIMTDKFIWKD